MGTVSAGYTWNTGDLITAARLNANNSAYVAGFTNIDNTNIGTAGIYASQIKPTTSAQATFGGSAVGYVFLSLSTAVTPLTVSGIAGQSVDIFDVTLTSGGTKALAIGSTGAATFSGTLQSAGSILAGGAAEYLGYPGELGTAIATSQGIINFGTSGTTGGIFSFDGSQFNTLLATATTYMPIRAGTSSSVGGYVAPVYTAAGAALASTTHIVQGYVYGTSGSSTVVTLSGAAAFSSATSYAVACTTNTNLGDPVLYVTQNSGTSFTVTFSGTTGSNQATFIAIGS